MDDLGRKQEVNRGIAMAKSVRISPQAHNDIKGIYDYVLKDGEDIAGKQVEAIYKGIQNLSLFPEIGIATQRFVERKTDLKILVINKVYIVAYENGDTVDIIRVFRKDQDYISQLFDFED